MSAPEYADAAICPLLQHESGRFRLQISAAGKTAAARAAAELVPEALVPLADTVLQEPETGAQLPWDFSVVFCSNAFMQDLNRRFRNIDAPTDVLSFALGGAFLTSDAVLPQVVEKQDGLKGAYSVCGLMTYRFNTQCFAPDEDSILKLDIFCDNAAAVQFTMSDMSSGQIYEATLNVAGGIWQNILLKSKDFLSDQGMHLQSFTGRLRFTITCSEQYAVNNIMWL